MHLLLALALSFPAALPVQEAAALLERISAERDDVDAALIHRLGALRTREAALALVEAYDVMSSPLARREVLLALGGFDGVADAEQPALQRVADVATADEVLELRRAALEVLDAAPSMGHEFLRAIVQSPASDDVRIDAMRRLVAAATPEDGPWFRQVFDEPRQLDDKGLRAAVKRGRKVVRVDTLTQVRELAFERVALELEPPELAAFAREKERDATDLRKDVIRRTALLELERREDRRLAKLAQEVFEDRTEAGANRALAARMLATARGAKVYAAFVKEGLEDPSVTPLELRLTLAELAHELREPRDERKLVKELRKARGHQLAFLLLVLRGSQDDKARAAAGDAALGSDRDAALAGVEFLTACAGEEAAGTLEAALHAAGDASVAVAALRGLGTLRAGDPTWEGELVHLCGSDGRRVRNAALGELAGTAAAQHVEVFERALEHPDWTTRLVALDALAGLATREAVAAVVARMGVEEGRVLERFADVLWRLTGQPFRTAATSWQAWWRDASADFVPITAEELMALELNEERRRLAQVSRATSFFGVRVVSRRLVFVLDVSGSMDEPIGGTYLGEEGPSRLERAKQELTRFIDEVEPGTLYNLILFSNSVRSWTDGDIGDSTEAMRSAAKEFVQGIVAGGGTNLYGGLNGAFSDPDVDTIVLLSDGEPSVGRRTDSWEIRREVARWNEGRGVVIHTVAVGGSLRILEWLAEDTGGAFIQFR